MTTVSDPLAHNFAELRKFARISAEATIDLSESFEEEFPGNDDPEEVKVPFRMLADARHHAKIVVALVEKLEQVHGGASISGGD